MNTLDDENYNKANNANANCGGSMIDGVGGASIADKRVEVPLAADVEIRKRFSQVEPHVNSKGRDGQLRNT